MRNKIIQYLQEEKRAINVRSEKQWIELMQYFEFYDVQWVDNDKATSFIGFEIYKEESSIVLGFSKDEELGYDNNHFNKSEGYIIILFKEFKKEFMNQDKHYQIYLLKQKLDKLEKQIKEENQKYYARFKLKENDLNYLKYDKNEQTYGIASNWENQNHKSKFTQKELKE